MLAGSPVKLLLTARGKSGVSLSLIHIFCVAEDASGVREAAQKALG